MYFTSIIKNILKQKYKILTKKLKTARYVLIVFITEVTKVITE